MSDEQIDHENRTSMQKIEQTTKEMIIKSQFERDFIEKIQ
jgi:hypothetical protein